MSSDLKELLRLMAVVVAATARQHEYIQVGPDELPASLAVWPGERLALKIESLSAKIIAEDALIPTITFRTKAEPSDLEKIWDVGGFPKNPYSD